MEPPRTLPALIVQVEGSVLSTNIDAYRTAALDYVDSINTTLTTDEDFVEAEGIVKWCASAETKIKQVKAEAMEQAAEINLVFSALDEISEALRDKRLTLSRQVKAEKENRKRELVDGAMSALVRYVAELESSLGGLRLPSAEDRHQDLVAATKKKRTLSSLQDALDGALEAAKHDYQGAYRVMSANVATLRANEEYGFLFSDAQEHVTKDPDDFENLVKARIAEHKESERERIEAERERIRAEERAKAESGMRADLEAERPGETDSHAVDGDVAMESGAGDSAQASATSPQQQMQTIMYALTKLAAEKGFAKFLADCGLSENDYRRIKVEWREKLGVEPYC